MNSPAFHTQLNRYGSVEAAAPTMLNRYPGGVAVVLLVVSWLLDSLREVIAEHSLANLFL